MKKNGRTAKGVQRWKRPDCSLSPTMPQERAAHARVPGEFLARLPGRQPQCALDPSGDSPALRKRTAWCWNIHPSIPPVTARHHTVMADGTCMGHGWCLIIAIDGESGETLGFQWCGHESKAAYTALFSRMPAPDVPITDGLRGAEAACQEAWPGTRIQRCLAHVQRNTRTDLTSKPKLEAGGQLKKLSDRLTKAHDGETAVKWGEALNAWHITWGSFINERTHAKDDPTNPKAMRRQWRWTHEDVRRCHRRLERLFREGKPFAFLDPAPHRRRAGGTHHEPIGRRRQLAAQARAPRPPRTARGAHATRPRMGVLHEKRQSRPRVADQTGTLETRQGRSGTGRGRRRAEILRHRHPGQQPRRPRKRARLLHPQGTRPMIRGRSA